MRGSGSWTSPSRSRRGNEIARKFDAEEGQPGQQFDFVLFLDGNERSDRAVEASLNEFRRSWRRPKWHIIAASEAPPAS